METMIGTVMWIIFILGLLLLPAILFLFLGRKHDKRKRAIILSSILLLAELLLFVLTVIHPPLFNDSGNPLSDESVEIVRYVSDGKLNDRTAIFPIAVVVTENSPVLLRWRTYYGIYGSTEHIWDVVNECYECTDQLWE